MKRLSVFIGILFCSNLVQSQITFTQNDYPTPGLTIEYYQGWSDSLDLGAAGASQLFDFSKALSNLEDTIEYSFIAPSSTPYASSHPDATVAFLGDTEKDSATNKTVFKLWRFIEISTISSKTVGVTLEVDTAYMFSQAPPSTLTPYHSALTPAEEYVGSTWTFNSTLGTNSSWSVIAGSLKHSESTQRNIFIDAWGTFKNPWQSFDAMRFRVTEYVTGTDSINGQLDDVWIDTNHYLEYWVNGLGHYIARVYTASDFQTVWRFEMANKRNPIGIEQPKSAVEFNLYPVPAHQTLYFTGSFEGLVEYSINDVNGRLVSSGTVNCETGAVHQIELSNIEQGFYFLNLRSEGAVLGTKKFVIE